MYTFIQIPRILILVLSILGFVLWSASISADKLTSLGAADILSGKKIVFVVGERIYDTDNRLRRFSASTLAPLGAESIFITPDSGDKNSFPGLIEALQSADLLVISVRRRALHKEQMNSLKGYIFSGKPVIGIRTASHGFDTKGRARWPYTDWADFGEDIFGVKYGGHGPAGRQIVVMPIGEEASSHPILDGIAFPYITTDELYRAGNQEDEVEVLLTGTAPGGEIQAVAWTYVTENTCAFYTSLVDLENRSYITLLVNAMQWALSTRAD